MLTLTTLRKLHTVARAEAELIRSSATPAADLRDLLTLGYARGGRALTVARMAERMLRR